MSRSPFGLRLVPPSFCKRAFYVTMSLSESDESLFDDLEFNAPDAPAAPPPARWESVDVDGRKRRCLWKDADGGVCGKVVANDNQVFKRHWQTHTGERSFKCDLCAYTCIRSDTLTAHKRTHTGEKPFLCDKCDKKFARSGELTQHKRTHSGEKPFKCDNCDKTFSTSRRLTVHKRSHSGENPFKCDTCQKAFAEGGSLQAHKRTHSGEKPFKCNQCDKAFAQGGGLQAHKRTHSGEKPFKCDTCQKEFTTSFGLQVHKRRHSGEKPYKCDKCDKTFARSGTLQKHKRAVHDGVLQKACPGATGVEACPYGLTKLPKYENMCVRCFCASFPNDARASNAKKYLHAKELSVRAFLEEEFPTYRWLFDRTCAVGAPAGPRK